MGIPQNVASSEYIPGEFLPPYDRYRTPFVDFEKGGIEIQNPILGIDFQVWKLTYVDDEEAPNYGDFILTPESVGGPVVALNVPGVKRVGLAFDQNMNVFITYELKAGGVSYYWYDTTVEDYVTDTLPAGSRSPQCCHDDHRDLQVQLGVTDILLAYVRSGTVYLRYLSDRFTVERNPNPTANVGTADINRIGMTSQLRVEFDIGSGRDVRLSTIVGDIANECEIRGDEIEVSEGYPTIVRGYQVNSLEAGADFIRGLQRVYYFDMPEIDGTLSLLMRGREVILDVPHDDIVYGHDVIVDTAREQEIEFPRKLHLAYASQETEWTPTKATSERLSANVKVRSELSVECFVNFEATEAAERADIMHKSAWVELEGKIKAGIPDKYKKLVPGSVIRLEIRPGVWKRIRLESMNTRSGVIEIEAKYDRKSAWSSGAVTAQILPPTPPPSSLPGSTIWEFLDLPALLTAHDTLHYYIVGHGSAAAWNGAQVQRETGGEYIKDGDITRSGTIGALDVALPYSPALYTDTTNTLTVTTNKPLESCSLERLLQGANAAVVGDEILQFRDVLNIGLNQWELSYLLRGRLDSIATSHSIGERFVYLGEPARIQLDVGLVDQDFNLRVPSYGEVPSSATPELVSFTGESQREWAPIDLTSDNAGGDWAFTWTPRFRLGTSINPIKSAYHYGWRVRVTKGATVKFYDVLDPLNPTFTLTAAQQTADFGGAVTSPFDVEVMGLNQFTGEGRLLQETL